MKIGFYADLVSSPFIKHDNNSDPFKLTWEFSKLANNSTLSYMNSSPTTIFNGVNVHLENISPLNKRFRLCSFRCFCCLTAGKFARIQNTEIGFLVLGNGNACFVS